MGHCQKYGVQGFRQWQICRGLLPAAAFLLAVIPDDRHDVENVLLCCQLRLSDWLRAEARSACRRLQARHARGGEEGARETYEDCGGELLDAHARRLGDRCAKLVPHGAPGRYGMPRAAVDWSGADSPAGRATSMSRGPQAAVAGAGGLKCD